jgi:mono/diheme cytochrome c family protein
MRTKILLFTVCMLVVCGCNRRKQASTAPQSTAHGTAIIQVSGEKQVAQTGATVDQPVIVQVNDAQGNAVAGAAVEFRGSGGTEFNPASGLTDSSGQVSTAVTLGAVAGRYQITAVTRDSSGKEIPAKLEEIALGYQQTLGQQLNRQYCSRCHDQESTPERVSNYDNLNTKPHPFTEGDTLNKISDADLASITGHGGAALGKSAEMPAFSYTLSKSEIQALIAYMRAVSDPPYQTAGVVYAKK